MALFFAVGSTCFLVGPFPGYADLVGPKADALTFFVGSIFFTLGGGLQTLIALPERRSSSVGKGRLNGPNSVPKKPPVVKAFSSSDSPTPSSR